MLSAASAAANGEHKNDARQSVSQPVGKEEKERGRIISQRLAPAHH